MTTVTIDLGIGTDFRIVENMVIPDIGKTILLQINKMGWLNTLWEYTVTIFTLPYYLIQYNEPAYRRLAIEWPLLTDSSDEEATELLSDDESLSRSIYREGLGDLLKN